MTFQNPIGFVKRIEIPMTIQGQDITGFAIDLEELKALGDRFPIFGRQIRGEKIEMDLDARVELLNVASAVVATSLAPDATGDQRAQVETSARAIANEQRVELMEKVLVTSFPELAAALKSAEGNVPAKPNRQQRRAVRSTGGGAKPRT